MVPMLLRCFARYLYVPTMLLGLNGVALYLMAHKPDLGIFGDASVNVLKLNLALDSLSSTSATTAKSD